MAILEARIRSGLVRGVRANNPGFSIFKGIPFAGPPVGALRYAPPQPVAPWEGVLDCDRWKPACMQDLHSHGLYQKEFYPEPKTISEDCLYLNIWTPAKEPGEKLPVFFWIHGGGYQDGYGHEMEFDGEAMCKRGCILVSINYRCNSFGFFAHPELTRRFGKSGDAGMYDQIAALQWVHDNIAAFGGDPENVTVHGQSAGCMSARFLLASPLCRGLMKRVILQSGGGLNEWAPFRTMEEQERLGVQLLEAAGISLDELLAMDSQTAFDTLKAAGARLANNPIQLFCPCLDGEALSDPPGVCIARGEINTDSIICGSVGGDARHQKQSLEISSDVIPQNPSTFCYGSTIGLARNRAAAGKPIYGYEFDRNPPGDDAGPFHSVELWYMFSSLHRCWRPWTGYDYELSDAMVDYWCAFARTGDPNVPGRPEWPRFTAEDPRILYIDDAGICAMDPIRTPEDEAIAARCSRP